MQKVDTLSRLGAAGVVSVVRGESKSPIKQR